MSTFAINANPLFNTTAVERINQTDPVVNDAMNAYFETLLSNDQALKVMNDDTKKKLSDLEASTKQQIIEARPSECSEADVLAPFLNA